MTVSKSNKGLNKAHIVDMVAKKSGLTKADSERAVEAFLEALVEGVKKEGRVSLVRYMTIAKSRRKATKARNPRTGEVLSVPAKTVVRIKAGSALRDLFAKDK